MTKRAAVSAKAGVCINETELGILLTLSSAPEGVKIMSITDLSSDLDRSNGAIRNAIKALERKGLIDIHERFLRNGGRLENEYELTSDGRRVVSLA